ncbi:MAG: deoxyribodipyrimidine photo-lyase/cryptochrome family protein [Bacteroidia bacterium]
MLSAINIVWLKRDLRLQDHAPIAAAIAAGKPCVLVYIFEPSLVHSDDYDERHWRFVWESLQDMQKRLEPFQVSICICYEEVEAVFDKMATQHSIDTVFSYQETGIKITYDRDIVMGKWFGKKGITWTEFQTGGVVRGLRNRKSWRKQLMASYMGAQDEVDMSLFPKFRFTDSLTAGIQAKPIPTNWQEQNPQFQPGGESAAWRYLNSFFQKRYARYQVNISKPSTSRTSCSRLSPYITWGCLSTRQVFQAYEAKRQQTPNTRNLDSFVSRLLWQSHFIQKFEMEDTMEFVNTNKGYDRIRTAWNEEHYQAWAEARTGYPLVDACMICLRETGWVNFRMRAMLLSFLTHNLWLDWKKGAQHLGRYFLDFEPGIHYPQVQMQAGTTGVNTYRIYNPVSQSEKQDPEGVFIKKWIPALANLPKSAIHKPWELPPLEQQWLNFTPGTDYPLPIVDLKKSYKYAQENLWAMNDDPVVQAESVRILKRHVNPNRNRWAKVAR